MEDDRAPLSAVASASYERYLKLAHGMQTGVLLMMELEPENAATQPKHLRTGINSALVDQAALVKTLVDAGVITEDAYFLNMEAMMRAEVGRYEKEIQRLTGNPLLKLGLPA